MPFFPILPPLQQGLVKDTGEFIWITKQCGSWLCCFNTYYYLKKGC
jgi:hypothetical protein